MLSCVFALFSVFGLAHAAAAPPRGAFKTLSATQVQSFKPYSLYAAAAYCPPSQTQSWSCAKCSGNPAFRPYASGGDGTGTQFWYVGWDPTLNSVIVAHQGTNPTSILADLTDLNVLLHRLDPALFPGVPSSIQVHHGFALEHAKTAPTILAAVQALLKQHNASSVVLTGHSLGAALALLDSVYLPLHLPPSTRVRTIGYGMPRVGNRAFADYVDALHGDGGGLTRVNNKRDPIPIVPGRFLGFVHPSGEVHIQDEGGEWVPCPGHDDTSPLCIVGDVRDVLQANILDHISPYDDGVFMGLC